MNARPTLGCVSTALSHVYILKRDRITALGFVAALCLPDGS